MALGAGSGVTYCRYRSYAIKKSRSAPGTRKSLHCRPLILLSLVGGFPYVSTVLSFILLLLALALGGLASRSLLAQRRVGRRTLLRINSTNSRRKMVRCRAIPRPVMCRRPERILRPNIPLTASAAGNRAAAGPSCRRTTRRSPVSNAPNPRSAEPGLPPSLTGQPARSARSMAGAADPSLATRSIDVQYVCRADVGEQRLLDVADHAGGLDV